MKSAIMAVGVELLTSGMPRLPRQLSTWVRTGCEKEEGDRLGELCDWLHEGMSTITIGARNCILPRKEGLLHG